MRARCSKFVIVIAVGGEEAVARARARACRKSQPSVIRGRTRYTDNAIGYCYSCPRTRPLGRSLRPERTSARSQTLINQLIPINELKKKKKAEGEEERERR